MPTAKSAKNGPKRQPYETLKKKIENQVNP